MAILKRPYFLSVLSIFSKPRVFAKSQGNFGKFPLAIPVIVLDNYRMFKWKQFRVLIDVLVVGME